MCDRDSNFSIQIEDSDSKLTFDDCVKERTSEECWKCWKFSEPRLKEEVKILNPKYCWLYPKRSTKQLKKIVPNYEDCKTLYTKCDLKLEACVHEQMLKIETYLKKYEKLFRKEWNSQTELIEPIWELSVRYCLLTESSCRIKYYPEIVSGPTERRVLCEFESLLKNLSYSNCRLRDSLNQIKDEIDELDRRATYLDMTVESPFLLGDGGQHRSFAYIREMISDLFTYFYTIYCELRTWAQLIDPVDTAAIEDYKAILESAHDFDGFMIVGVPKCSCRRANFVNCTNQHKPC